MIEPRNVAVCDRCDAEESCLHKSFGATARTPFDWSELARRTSTGGLETVAVYCPSCTETIRDHPKVGR